MKTILRGIMVSFLFLISFSSLAINQNDIVNKGIELYDNGEYQKAIELFSTVDENDSSYVWMLSELALTYNALENHDSTIIICRKGLQEFSSYRGHLLELMATAYDKNGEIDSAVHYYQKSLNIEPYNYLKHFNLGVTYYNSEQYRLAVDCFQEALRCNPFHPTSHLYLGFIATRQQQLTKAMMSLETFLLLEPSSERSNSILIYLNNLAQNYIDTAYGEFLEPFLDNQAYELTDHIIRSRMVLNSDFETIIDFDAPVVKQTQVLFDKLPNEQPDDFWGEMYWAFFKAIKEKSYIEPMMFTLLRSTGSEVVSKWTNKNDKTLKTFYNTGSHLANIKQYKDLDLDGELKRYAVEYSNNGNLFSIGNYVDGKEDGYFQYFYENGILNAEGVYDNGEKTGTWKYYTWEGYLDYVGEMKNGKNEGIGKQYYPFRGVSYKAMFKDNIPDGSVEFYSKTGKITEICDFKAGERDGKDVAFFSNGDTVSIEHYSEGNLEGPYVRYYRNGTMAEKCNFSEDKLEGDYCSYFHNGQIESKGKFNAGNRTGEWFTYFENGIINEHLMYNDSVLCGESKDYYPNGELCTVYHYNEKGELEGSIDYHTCDGVLYLSEEYVADKIIGVKSFNASSEILAEYSSPTGTFDYKSYYPSGQLHQNGRLVNGEKEGQWTAYWMNGNASVIEDYSDEKLIGEKRVFYINGQLKEKTIYDAYKGLDEYTSYYENGEIKNHGYILDNNICYQWCYYYPDGNLSQKAYYANGVAEGWITHYAKNETIADKMRYENNQIIKALEYGPDGDIIHSNDFFQEELFTQTDTAGNVIIEASVIDLKYQGDMIWYYPNGKISTKETFVEDKCHGKYQHWNRKGILTGEGYISQGNKTGNWKWYHDNGKLYEDETYLYDELDSTQYYYNEEGVLINESKYNIGLKHGAFISYDNQGTPMIKVNYYMDELVSYQSPKENGWGDEQLITNGNEKIESYYPNGTLAYQVQLKDFLFEGILIKNNSDGSVMSKMSYRSGIRDGVKETYYSNGQLRYQKQYYCGKLNGISKWYYPNGELEQKCELYMDNNEGESRYYNTQGELESSEYYFYDRFMYYISE